MRKSAIRTVRMALLPLLCAAGLSACSRGDDNHSDGVSGQETASPSEATDYSALAADATQVEIGKKLFSNCAVCHSIDPNIPSPAGPQLAGVVGRKIAGAAGFPYTEALKKDGGDWTPDKLDGFLKDPQTAYPGTAMAFGGLAKEADRKAIIAFLASHAAK